MRTTDTGAPGAAIDEAAGSVAVELEVAIRETVASGSPEPARELIDRLTRSDAEQDAFDEGPSMELLAALTLASWLNEALTELAHRPRLVEDVHGWIEAILGPVTAPVDEQGTDALWAFVYARHGEHVPALVWLLAALEACHGVTPGRRHGDVPVGSAGSGDRRRTEDHVAAGVRAVERDGLSRRDTAQRLAQRDPHAALHG